MNNYYFKVVTDDMKSLGLRNNPTILKYKLGFWTISPTIRDGKCDDGGIWVCATRSGANKLKKYMINKHNIKTRIFGCVVDDILYKNSYRIKTNQIMLWSEIDS